MQERIQLIMQTEDLNITQFAEEIGVNASSISHIISGRNKASLDIATKILERFTEINPDWLLLGEGRMLRSANKASEEVGDEYSLFSKDEPETPKEIEYQGGIDDSAQDRIKELKEKIRDLENNSRNIEPISDKADNKDGVELIENKKELAISPKPEAFKEKKIAKIMVFYNDSTYEELIN